MELILQESTISFTNVHKRVLLQIAAWIIKKTQVILQLNKLPKTKTHPNTYLEKFHTILLYHPDHQYIFVDGSKDSNNRVCATVRKKAFPMKRFIFTAEICAIDLALNIISKNKQQNFIIFSDSLSVLASLRIKSRGSH